MPRIRTIKPEFPQSESMGRVSRAARLLFILLWTIADDSGRTRANSRMLASLLFPYDEDAAGLIPGWLRELEDQNCIQLYEFDTCAYLQIEKWDAHQKIDRPSPSKFPQAPSRAKARPQIASAREPLANAREASALDQGRDQGREGTKDKDQGVVPPQAPLNAGGGDLSNGSNTQKSLRKRKTVLSGRMLAEFNTFYAAYPRREAVGDAEKFYIRAREIATAEQILEGAKRYARAKEGEDKQFLKLPATWLNKKCWLDETDPAQDARDARDTPQHHRISALKAYANTGWWPKNDSGNGVWRDVLGVGAPPHDPRTMVTELDFDVVPAAREMRARKMSEAKRAPAEVH